MTCAPSADAIALVQAAATVATLLVVIWYTYETNLLRESAKQQVDLARTESERAVRREKAAAAPDFRATVEDVTTHGASISLRNVGATARDVRLSSHGAAVHTPERVLLASGETMRVSLDRAPAPDDVWTLTFSVTATDALGERCDASFRVDSVTRTVHQTA